MQRESGGTEATVPKRYTFGSQLGIFKLMLLFILAVSTLWAQALNEMLLSADTAYNPIPSPDGKMIAYARAGWGRPDGIVGLGLSDLVSEVFVMHEDGAPVTGESPNGQVSSGMDTEPGKPLAKTSAVAWSFRSLIRFGKGAHSTCLVSSSFYLWLFPELRSCSSFSYQIIFNTPITG
jgi:hypothetical protein